MPISGSKVHQVLQRPRTVWCVHGHTSQLAGRNLLPKPAIRKRVCSTPRISCRVLRRGLPAHASQEGSEHPQGTAGSCRFRKAMGRRAAASESAQRFGQRLVFRRLDSRADQRTWPAPGLLRRGSAVHRYHRKLPRTKGCIAARTFNPWNKEVQPELGECVKTDTPPTHIQGPCPAARAQVHQGDGLRLPDSRLRTNT